MQEWRNLEGLESADPPTSEAKLDLHSWARLALEGERFVGVEGRGLAGEDGLLG